jgi:NTE family protein
MKLDAYTKIRTGMKKGLAVLLLLLAAPSLCFGADAAPEGKPRPRIGLVLSGGGARGGAHVGILEVLEELRVPVDIIVGTSMGAVVGGIYATGTPTEELEKLATGLDWKEIFTEKVPREKQFYRRKADRGNYLVGIRMDGQKGLVIPSGLVSGKKLNLVLRSLTLGAGNDFDAFPVPFRAVAADIETGDIAVLGKGDLARSLNASMAIPGIFCPVEIDGRLLVDGGVARNLPIDVARQMGADVIIAVDISTPLNKRDKLSNFFSISDQTTGFLTTRNVAEQVKTLTPGDILIVPDMKDVTTMSFMKMDKAIRIGRDAALARAGDLSRYALSEAGYQAFKKEQLLKSRRPAHIDFVEVKQKDILNANILSGYVKEKWEKFRGKPPKTEDLSQALFEISDRADLENIDFDLVEKDDSQGLLISVKAKEHVQHNIELGLQLSDDFKGNSSYDILLKYTLSHINSLDAEWKNKFRFGEKRGVFTEFYQPLSSSAWRVFGAPYLEASAIPLNLYDGSSKIAEYEQRNFTEGADMGMQLAEYGEARLGLLKGSTDLTLETGAPSLPNLSFRSGAWKAALEIDQLDNMSFPSRGALLRTRFLAQRTSLGATGNFNMLEVSAAKPFSWGRSTLILRGRFDSVLDNTEDAPQYFLLGGFLDLSGMAPGQLFGQQIVLGECVYTYRLLNEKFFGNDLYAGISYEMGNAWENRSDIDLGDLLHAGSVFLGADSIIGPVYLAYGHAEGGYDAVYFIIGFFY